MEYPRFAGAGRAMAAQIDYCRAVPKVSLKMQLRLWITAVCPTPRVSSDRSRSAGRMLGAPSFLRLGWGTVLLFSTTLPVAPQYPGQIARTKKDTLNLRAVAVFEWTGDEAKPKNSRLVPVCIYDGQDLQDAGAYLARPAPIALESEVEYHLLKDGHPVGLFDVDRAGQQQGSWIAFGK